MYLSKVIVYGTVFLLEIYTQRAPKVL